MGSKGGTYAGQVLDQALFGKPLPWLDADLLVLSLHTGEPEGRDGTLLAEADYPGYHRISIDRDATQWQREANTARNRQALRFPTCDEAFVGDVRLTHWAIRPSNSNVIVWRGALAVPIVVCAMVRPVVDAGGIEIEEH